jgi:hypothetical protein
MIGHKAFEIELLILFLFFTHLHNDPTNDAVFNHCHANHCSSSQDAVLHLLGAGNGSLLSAAGTALAAGEVLTLTGDLLGGLLNNLSTLSEDHLNVAGVGHVRVDL